MNKAIALLAMRVSDLEKESPGESKYPLSFLYITLAFPMA